MKIPMSEFEACQARGWAVEYSRTINRKGASVEKVLKDAAKIYQFTADLPKAKVLEIHPLSWSLTSTIVPRE